MKNFIFFTIACLLFISLACSKNESITTQDLKISQEKFESDKDFQMLMKKTAENMQRYQSVLSKLPKEKIQSNLDIVNSLLYKKNLRSSEGENLSTLLGFKSYAEMEKNKEDFLMLNNKVQEKFPNLKYEINSGAVKDKISKSIMNHYDANPYEEFPGDDVTGNGDNNCQGIYQACVATAGTAGGVCIIATGGIGSYACVLAAAAAMEYCRQQRLACK
jgi:hypothetical protein